MKLRPKISLTYLGLVLAGVGLVSLLSSWAVQRYVEERTVLTVHEQLEVLSDLLARGNLSLDSLGGTDTELHRIARTLNLRITLIRHQGVVAFDSDVPQDSLGQLENHAGRPEIVQARERGTGSDRRHSASVGVDFLYAARVITGPGAGSLDSGYVRVALPVHEITAIDRRVQVIVWGVGLFTALLTILASFQISRRITRPILGIAATARRIQEGDLGQRISIESDDEIADLSKSINDMAAKLSSDIAQLRKLERIRSEFLGNVSHELRTPIFSIQGFLETLLDGAIDDPAVNRDFLEKAHRHALRLNALLSDLLEISRIESGDMQMSFRYFDVREFLEEVYQEMHMQAQKKQVECSLDLALAEGERVLGDRARVKQVMVNLVDNAIKYTNSGGKIVCRAVTKPGEVVFTVEDTGCGIPPEHVPRIFERFYRVDRDRSREVGGTGLGLAIVKHIVEAHGSSVSVHSTAGQGSAFTFPLRK